MGQCGGPAAAMQLSALVAVTGSGRIVELYGSRCNETSVDRVLHIAMHPSHVLQDLICRFLAREDGFTIGEVMWSLACVALIATVAVVGGSAVSPEWRHAVARIIPGSQ